MIAKSFSLVKHRKTSTFLKYMISYLAIVSFLILGFYYIVSSWFEELYLQQCTERVETHVDSVATHLADSLLYLMMVDTAIANNGELREIRYQKEISPGEKYSIKSELRKYKSPSGLISDVVCYMNTSDEVFFLTHEIRRENDVFLISQNGSEPVEFDPGPYMNASEGQLIFLADESTPYLIWFPATSSYSNYVHFYLLQINEVYDRIKNLYSEETPAVAVVDGSGQVVAGMNTHLLASYLENTFSEDGIYVPVQESEMYICQKIIDDLSLVVMQSGDFLNRQIGEVFVRLYLLLVILGVLGILMSGWGMQLTYFPLRRLVKRVMPDADRDKIMNHIESLEKTFEMNDRENQRMREKLESNIGLMHKFLLDSFMTSVGGDGNNTYFEELDRLFDGQKDRKIFVLFVSGVDFDEQDREEYCRRYLTENMPGLELCTVMERRENGRVFLISCSGSQSDKEELLQKVLGQMEQESGCVMTLSDSSEFPFAIPYLYETVVKRVTYTYPYDKLEQIMELLKENNFREAEVMMMRLWDVVDEYYAREQDGQNFLGQCVLIDLLTCIVSTLNVMRVRFSCYSGLYYETLLCCRSMPWEESRETIRANFSSLLRVCEQNNAETVERSIHFVEVVEECYTDPDFSIATLAERCGVSVPYMSEMFNRGQNMKFSDYLWMLRLNKAKELLVDTDISIDDVAAAVGYASSSGFRRKFKQEMGVTPSQYREDTR